MDKVSEEERIRLWREEREKVAEKQKLERINAKKIEQEKLKKIKEQEIQSEVDVILPSIDEFNKERDLYIDGINKKRKQLKLSFWFYVILPSILLGLALKVIVTPLYSASSIVVVSNQNSSQDYSIAGVFSGVGGGDAKSDTYKAYEFIKSRAMMNELEIYNNFITNYSSNEIDFIFRLSDIAWLGLSKYNSMNNFIDASVDIQTSLISLEVKARTREEAISLSNAIIEITERHVNSLSDELYNSRIINEQFAVKEARSQIVEAQSKLLALQVSSGEQNPEVHIANIYNKIAKLEEQAMEFQTKILESKIAGLDKTKSISHMVENEKQVNNLIERYRNKLVISTEGRKKTLNSLLIDFEMTKLEVKIAEEMLSASLISLSQVRRDAANNKSVFQTVVVPKASELSQHPNILKSVFVAFLIFCSMFFFYRVVNNHS